MKAERISLERFKTHSEIVGDYLSTDSNSISFFPSQFSIKSFSDSIKSRDFSEHKRKVLHNSIKKQYEEQGIDLPSISKDQIQSLLEPNTFTVTTGHQLSLFTGPLFFVIKILQIIKLAKTLNDTYKEAHFVPMFWMATEDHDFEEINHIHLFGKRLEWPDKQGGAVGDYNLTSFKEILEPLDEILGDSERAIEIKNLFQKAYSNDKNLTQATRKLVHELFSDRGLLIIDGNDTDLKNLFKDYFKNEVENQVIFKEVEKTVKEFPDDYKVQVNAREVNIFYLEENSRKLIEHNQAVYSLKEGSKTWDQQTLLDEIENHPERFSPNVLLRPIYQECILPNLCYTGGPAEIAYWLEMKSTFKAFDVQMPLLNLRNSLMWLDKGKLKKLNKLSIQVDDLFVDESEINKRLADFETIESSLDKDIETVNQAFQQLGRKIEDTDASLKPTVLAEGRKIEKQLEQLKGRLLRAEKSKKEERINAYWNLYEKVFPSGNLHERYDNFVPYFLSYGWSFFDTIYEHLDPEDSRLLLIKDI